MKGERSFDSVEETKTAIIGDLAESGASPEQIHYLQQRNRLERCVLKNGDKYIIDWDKVNKMRQSATRARV